MFVISLLVMLPAMAVDMWRNNAITHVSEIALVVATIVTATRVRTPDRSAAIWAPAIVWFIALETVGQYGRDFAQENLKSQAVHLGYGLANHALAILGSTLLGIAVGAIRRARRP